MREGKSIYQYTLKRELAPGMARDGFPVTCDPMTVAKFLRGIGLDEEEREHFIVMTLDTKNRVRGYHTVSIGTIDRTLVSPRETFRLAIMEGATSIVVGHNHPSGVVEPSPEDITLTGNLRKSGDILGIRLIDHVIVGPDKHYSFAGEGML